MPIYSNRPKTARVGDAYYVFTGGESQGPYDLPFVQAMVLSGMLPADVSISADGKTGWKRLDTLVPAQNLKTPAAGGTSAPPPMPRATNPPPVPAKQSSSKGLLITAAVIGGLALLGHLSSQQSPPVYQQSSAPRADSSTYQPTPAPAVAVDTSTAYQPTTPAPVVQDTSATTTVPTPDTSTPASPPAYSAPTTYAPPASTYSPPPIVPPPTPSYSVRDNTGRIFNVSRAAYDVLTAKEVEMSHMMDVINALKASRAAQNSSIESARATLDNTDQNALDQFNAQVDRYNAGGDTLDRDIDAYNAAVDDHNAYLIREGTPAN